MTASRLTRGPLARPLADAAYLAVTLTCAAVVYLGTRHHPLAHQRFATVWLPGAFALVSIALLSFVERWSVTPRGILLGADVLAWVPLLALVVTARTGRSHLLLLLAIALCIKTAALLVALVRAAEQVRVSDRAAGWLLVAIAILFYVAPLPLVRLDRGLQLKGDEPHYVVSTISLLNDHDLFVEDEYAAHVYDPFYDRSLEPHAVPARDGHIASFHDSGLAILATAPYALGGWVAVLVAMAAVAGLTVREMYLMARGAGADPVAGLVAAALIGFSLPFAVFATQVYPEIPGAFLTAIAVRRMLAAPGRRGAAALITGVGLGVLPWLQVRFWAIVLPLLLAAILRWHDVRSRLLTLGPVALLTLGYVGLNAAVYGRPTLSPFLFHESIGPQLGPLVAAAGGPLGVLLDAVRPWLDPYDGPFWISPVTILAVAAVILALRRSGVVVRAALAAVALYSLLVGLHYLISTSGDSPPGRFLVAVVPLLVLPLATILDQRVRRLTLPLAGGLAAAGVVTLVISLAEPLLARYPFGGVGGPVAILGRRLHVPIDAILPSFRQPNGSALLKAALALGLIVGVAFLLDRRLGSRLRFSYSKAPYNGSRADLPG